MESTTFSTYNSKLILPNVRKSGHGSSISNRVCIAIIMRIISLE